MIRSGVLLQFLASHGYLILAFFVLCLKELADLIRNKFSFITTLLMEIQLSHCLEQLDSDCHWLVNSAPHMLIEDSVLEASIEGSANVLIGKLEVEVLLDCHH